MFFGWRCLMKGWTYRGDYNKHEREVSYEHVETPVPLRRRSVVD